MTGDNGIPSKNEIIQRLKSTEKNQLVVTPLIDFDQISPGVIDIRLNTDFIVTRRTRFGLIDPIRDKNDLDTKIKRYQEYTYRKLGESLTLHPTQFVLGSTLEYIKLPKDLTAYVLNRSSWGRLGLIIATAPVIHPGFAGSITLELTNVGDVPITLYPGIRIAQLVLHLTNEDDEPLKLSKYQYSVGPKFSNIHHDEEFDILKELGDKRNNS